MKQRARRSEDKAKRRAAILRAATELWSSGSDLSMTDVARRAGITKGTVYLYFETRQQLMRAVLQGLLDRQLDKRPGPFSRQQIKNLFGRVIAPATDKKPGRSTRRKRR